MKNKKSIYTYNWFLILCLLVIVFISSSCEDDNKEDTYGNPVVSNILSLGDDPTINSGFPDELVRVEGSGLSNVQEIVFDDIINVGFNTALNSDVALFFNVPFDVEKGSRFGKQNVTLKNQFGAIASTEFEIKQPEPILSVQDTFSPDKAEAGAEIRVFGDWFFNVEDVLIDGESVIDFNVVSPQELTFIFPEGKIETTEFTLVTAAGSVSKDLPILGGIVEILISDFEGNGIPSINDDYAADWFSYGDNMFRIANGIGADGSTGAEIIWDDTGADPFTGSSHQSIASVTTSTDAENAFLIIDINGDGFPGTVMEFVLEDDRSNWLFKVPLEGSGWQTLRLKMSDFGFSFDPSNQSNGDVNPSTIVAVKMQISHEGGAGVVPSGYKYDNIKFEVLELE
ncbi:hypothetical protein U6A24_04830 [Aquimarina gracilis]|uniref:IPT/TIG domain-containing protein n=1 Tax=Aquimarina gracilis TaxID=874422 RepID=A0ABU5ZRT1_9FLAO|nr:hypothetical protein [Aquimarina gracilis]MEB3344770.1 hypothetical protein [Aquimarina gracilis]